MDQRDADGNANDAGWLPSHDVIFGTTQAAVVEEFSTLSAARQQQHADQSVQPSPMLREAASCDDGLQPPAGDLEALWPPIAVVFESEPSSALDAVHQAPFEGTGDLRITAQPSSQSVPA